MAKDITLFLMFEGCAESAINFYVSVFTDSKIELIELYDDEKSNNFGSVKLAVIHIHGMKIMCIDSNKKHKFSFTPSTSLFIDCSNEQEIDYLFTQLSENGEVLVPLDNYGSGQKFTWVKDRFGLSWQLNLKNQLIEF